MHAECREELFKRPEAVKKIDYSEHNMKRSNDIEDCIVRTVNIVMPCNKVKTVNRAKTVNVVRSVNIIWAMNALNRMNAFISRRKRYIQPIYWHRL